MKETNDLAKPAEREINMWNKGFLQIYFAIFIAFLNSAINGYDLSLMGGIVVLKWFKLSIASFDLEVNPDDDATLISLLAMGTVTGTFLVGPIMNYFALLEVIPKSLLWLEIGRYFVGFGISFVTTAAPVYCVEIAHPIFRGRAGAVYNTGWFVGSIPASFILYGCSFVDSDLSWQLPLLLQAVFSGIVLVGSFFIPDSPRELMSKGKMDEARAFFVKYHADGNPNDPIIQEQINAFVEASALNGGEQGIANNFYDLLKTPVNRYRSMILLAVAFFSQWAGNFVAGYFFPQIAPYFGATDVQSQLFLNAILNIISWLACISLAFFADRINRRTQLIYGSIAFAVCFGFLTLSCGLYEPAQDKTWGIMAFISLVFFNIFYSMSWSPLNSLYPVECLDFNTRATGMAFCQFLINAASIIQTYVLAKGVQLFHWRFFGFYFVFDLFAAFVIYKLFPETKGRTLDEIDLIFNDSNPVACSLEYNKSKDV